VLPMMMLAVADGMVDHCMGAARSSSARHKTQQACIPTRQYQQDCIAELSDTVRNKVLRGFELRTGILHHPAFGWLLYLTHHVSVVSHRPIALCIAQLVETAGC